MAEAVITLIAWTTLPRGRTFPKCMFLFLQILQGISLRFCKFKIEEKINKVIVCDEKKLEDVKETQKGEELNDYKQILVVF